MEGIRAFKDLQVLELYDNQVENLDELGDDESEEQNAGETIKTLDMSYNVIRDMGPVRFCPNLVDLCKSILYPCSNWVCWFVFLLPTCVCRNVDIDIDIDSPVPTFGNYSFCRFGQ